VTLESSQPASAGSGIVAPDVPALLSASNAPAGK